MRLVPIFLRTLPLFLFLNVAHAAETAKVGCQPLTTDDAKAHHPPRFEDYSVTEHFQEKPAQVDLKSDPQAKHYETMLPRGSKEGPDFGGHYTIIGWGCGSSYMQFAIVNAKNGQVFFPPKIDSVRTVHVASTKEEESTLKYNGLRYR